MTKKFELVNPDILHVSTNHTGKMENMVSVSSSCLLNPFCNAYRKDKECICSKCFAYAHSNRLGEDSAFNVYLENNTRLLQDIIDFEKLPLVNSFIARFEAFGDISCKEHFINFINICEKNPYTTFALWTKNPFIIDEVLKSGIEKPSNMIIVVSSRYFNKVVDIEKYRYFVDIVFTVYTCDYAIENNVNINCGWRKCFECKRCYTKHDGIIYVNEMLKSQLPRYKKLKGML